MKIVTISSLKELYWQQAEKEYLKRIKLFLPIEIVELKNSKRTIEAQIILEEGQKILTKIKKDDFVVCLDENGDQINSQIFANKINEWQINSQQIVFVVGGSFGLSKLVLDRADETVALSKMTFPHEMARIVLLEQIYRSMMILGGKKYHH